MSPLATDQGDYARWLRSLRAPDTANLAAGRKTAPRRHDYLSTACFHEMHTRCRLTCKFCDARCSCACHPALVDRP